MHVSPSKRPGAALVTSPNEAKRTSEDPGGPDLDLDLADFGFPVRNGENVRLDVTAAGRERAVNEPTLGWPSYERVFGVARVDPLTDASFNTSPLRDSDLTAVYRRDGIVDPAPRALYDCGAERVDSSEFRMLTGDGLEFGFRGV